MPRVPDSEVPGDRTVQDRLDSWKEIALYLRRDIRTVQRWELKEGLPVHRHFHDRQGSVYAYRQEVDAWVAERRLQPGAAETESVLAELLADELPRRVPQVTQQHIVGREKEMSELRSAFESAVSRRGLVLCVTGEAGIGKTVLVEDFLREIGEADPPCWIARGLCSERLAGAEAYLPFLEALESLLEEDSGEVVQRIMRRQAPGWFLQAARLSRHYGPQAGEAKPESQERMKREMVGLLQELSRLRRVVVFFDDLHWVDVSTVDMMAYLAARFSALRILVIVTYRPSELYLAKHPFLQILPDLQSKGICPEMALQFLCRDDVARYLALEFPGNQFPGDFADFIHSRTEGNPLFVVDLLRYLRELGAIAEVTGKGTVAQTIPEIKSHLPESVRGMIQKKIDQLSDADRSLLSVASIQGNEFDTSVLSDVLQTGPGGDRGAPRASGSGTFICAAAWGEGVSRQSSGPVVSICSHFVSERASNIAGSGAEIGAECGCRSVVGGSLR